MRLLSMLNQTPDPLRVNTLNVTTSPAFMKLYNSNIDARNTINELVGTVPECATSEDIADLCQLFAELRDNVLSSVTHPFSQLTHVMNRDGITQEAIRPAGITIYMPTTYLK